MIKSNKECIIKGKKLYMDYKCWKWRESQAWNGRVWFTWRIPKLDWYGTVLLYSWFRPNKNDDALLKWRHASISRAIRYSRLSEAPRVDQWLAGNLFPPKLIFCFRYFLLSLGLYIKLSLCNYSVTTQLSFINHQSILESL